MAKKRQVETKKKMGRPRSLVVDDVTLGKIKLIAAGQHSQEEAAAILGVCHATFKNFLASNEKVREAWEDGKHSGLSSLRRMQFVAAEGGSIPMQIWLGKQYLGQKDKSDVNQTHEMGESLRQLWALLGAKRGEASNA